MCHIGTSLLTVVLFAALSFAAESTPRISSEHVRLWMGQLNDDDFAVRETAAVRLAHAGPIAIGALAEGIVSSNPEVSWRASEVLRRMAMEGDEATMDRIVATLTEISKRGQPGLAKFASQMRQRQREFRHNRAVAELRKHGGRVTTAYGEEVMGDAGFADADADFEFAGGMLIEDIDIAEGIEEVPLDFAEEMPLDDLEVEMEELDAAGPELPPVVGRVAEAILPGRIGAAIRRAFGGIEAIMPPLPIADIDPDSLPDFSLPGLPGEPVEEEAAIEIAELEEPVMEAVEVEPAAMIMLGGMIVPGGGEAGGAMWLSREWRGGDEGLKHVKDLHGVSTLQIESAEITDAALDYLVQMPALKYIQIRGGKFSREALRKFHRAKPEVSIMALGEGMMGVNGQFSGECKLDTVFPGSAAAEAGIVPGDIITKIAGDDIRDFSELTIAVSTRKPGDKLTVNLQREGEDKEVILILKPRGPGQ